MTSMALPSQDGGTGLNGGTCLDRSSPGEECAGAAVGGVALPRASVSTKAPLPSFCNAGAGLQPRGASASLSLGVGGCACGYFPCKTSLGLPSWRNPGVGGRGQPPWDARAAGLG